MKWFLRTAQIILLLGWTSDLSAQDRDGQPVSSEPAEGTSDFSLALTAGWDFANFHFKDIGVPSPQGDNSDPGYQVGLAGEFFAFRDRKWLIVFQPTYQASAGSNPDRHHQSVELPTGVRRYFLLESADLFLDAFVVPDVPILYEATTDPSLPEAKVTGGVGLCAALGGGVRVKRFSLEARYYIQRSFTDIYIAQYTKVSIILGVRLTK